MFFFFLGDAEVNKSEQKLTNQWMGGELGNPSDPLSSQIPSGLGVRDNV